MQFSSLAVFCGSKSGADPLFTEHAKQLGAMMAQKNIKLVYGGGGKGLMGTVADAVMENQGKGIGIIDEMFEMLTWNTLNIHNKKLFLLNSNGYYNHLVAHIRHMEKENFLYEKMEERIVLVNDPAEIFNDAGF